MTVGLALKLLEVSSYHVTPIGHTLMYVVVEQYALVTPKKLTKKCISYVVCLWSFCLLKLKAVATLGHCAKGKGSGEH